MHNNILMILLLILLILIFARILYNYSIENLNFHSEPKCKKYADYYKSCPFYIDSTYNLSKNDISQNLNDSLENANYCADLCYADAYKIM